MSQEGISQAFNEMADEWSPARTLIHRLVRPAQPDRQETSRRREIGERIQAEHIL